MSALILPRRFKQQPQAPAPVDWTNPLAFGLAAATVFDNAGAVFDRITGVKYPVTNGTYRTDKPGRVTSFDGAGYVNTGKQSLGGVNLFADSTSQWSVVIYARLEGAGTSGTFVGKAGAYSAIRTLQIYRDAAAGHNPGVWLRGAQTIPNWEWGNADWHQYTITWDGSIAKLYGDYDREVNLNVGGESQESENIVFGARTGGAGGFLTGRIAYGYFYNRAIGRAESIALYNNPWQIFKAPARRLWAASAASGTHNLTASSATQSNSASTGPVTQAHKLTSSSLAQGNTASTGSVAQAHALVSSSLAQSNFASNTAISVGAAVTLSVVASAQSNTSSAASITQGHVLIHVPSVQDNIAASSAIVQAHILAAANPTQGNAAGTGVISFTGTNDLASSSITQNNTAGTGQIARAQTLTTASASQENRVSTAIISDGIVVETTSAASSSAISSGKIKKPGIPSETPAWLKTFLEIIVGRRGNKIALPPAQALTFSATPTQAELLALYSYTNDVRGALEQVVNRLDG